MAVAPTVQEKIDIEEIKDGVVILKDSSLRAVLMTTSLNFALKSTEEQDALTYAFQGFLNSLDFPIQIVIVSRKFEIANYIDMLEQKQKEQENELLRIQLSEYIDFIKGLSEMTNIITETFYVVVPFYLVETKEAGVFGKLTALAGLQKKSQEEEKRTFEELKNQLWQRVNFVQSGLESFGIRAVPLNNEELVELFYRLYNPEAKEKPPSLAA